MLRHAAYKKTSKKECFIEVGSFTKIKKSKNIQVRFKILPLKEDLEVIVKKPLKWIKLPAGKKFDVFKDKKIGPYFFKAGVNSRAKNDLIEYIIKKNKTCDWIIRKKNKEGGVLIFGKVPKKSFSKNCRFRVKAKLEKRESEIIDVNLNLKLDKKTILRWIVEKGPSYQKVFPGERSALSELKAITSNKLDVLYYLKKSCQFPIDYKIRDKTLFFVARTEQSFRPESCKIEVMARAKGAQVIKKFFTIEVLKKKSWTSSFEEYFINLFKRLELFFS